VAEVFPYSAYKGRIDVPPETAFPRGFTKNIPLIDIKVGYGAATTPTLNVLVDSGSVFCIFGLDVANYLGISVKSGNLRRNVAGIGGAVDLYFFDVTLTINSITIDCYAGFMDQNFASSVWVGLLGDHDFLSKLPVTLDVGNSEIRVG
jgi:hypothetical protein